MKNHPINWRLSIVLFLALAGAVAPGCGGSGGGGGGGGGGGTTGDEAVVTEAGTAITQAAQDRWGDALRAYNAALPEGLTPEECTSVIRSFEEANSTQGGSFTEAIYMIGVTHERCGHADQAREFYSRALQMNERFCGARVAAGIEHYRAGRVDQARGEFERSVRDDTRCTEGYVNLAIIQRRNPAQAADALNNLRRALAIDSNYLPAFNQMALLYLEQAVRQAGGQATVQGGVAAQTTAEGEGTGHHTTASQRTSSQMLDLAEVVCRQAQLIDGSYAPIYNTWGLINVQQGNIIAALAKFERAFQLDASLFEAYMNFGELTLSFRGYDDSAAAFTRATELRATSYDAFIGLGAAQRGLQDPDAAQAAYERAIALDANRPEAYFNLGLLFQDYRDGTETTLNRAVEYYNQFVSHAGSNPVFAPAVASVTHTCTPICPTPPAERGHSTRRRRRAVTCSMGRIQQIGQNLCLVREMAQMQADIAAMQAQIESQAASQSSETPPPDGATPPPDGAAPPPQ